MNDFLNNSISFLPYVSGLIIGTFFLYFEITSLRGGSSGISEGGNSASLSQGYRYNVNLRTEVNIVPKGARRYRIYILRGDPPDGVDVKHDRLGNWFPLIGNSAAEIETQLDRMFA